MHCVVSTSVLTNIEPIFRIIKSQNKRSPAIFKELCSIAEIENMDNPNPEKGKVRGTVIVQVQIPKTLFYIEWIVMSKNALLGRLI